MNHIFSTLIIAGVLTALPAAADIKMDMLHDKIDRLDREMTQLQRKIYQNTPTSALKSGDDTATPPPLGSLDDLYTRIDEQTKVVQELTNKIDLLEQNVSNLSSKMQAFSADTDLRFQELSRPKATTPAPQAKPTGDAKGAYDAAYALLKKGDYPKAEKAFILFLKNYPQSDLAGNANYWLGETYYARGLYEQAVGIFADGLSKYKKNSKAPDNMLKLGLTLKQLNKKKESCIAFTGLSKEFPKAGKTLKDRAASEAKKLSCP